MARTEPKTAKTLIFLHIPKSGGTTFHTVLSREYRHRPSMWTQHHEETIEALQGMPEHSRRDLALVRGHFHFGVHEFLGAEARYMTMLREPTGRVVSYYYHALNEARAHPERESRWHSLGREKLPLEEYLDRKLVVEMDNGMVRRLANSRVPFGELTTEDLERAWTNLEKHFDFVGLTERFDESLLAMREKFGWRLTPYYAVAKRSPNKRRVEDSLRDKILDANQLDAELYLRAKDRFEREIERMGPGFCDSVRKFRQRNRNVGRVLPIALSGWRLLRRLKNGK